MIWCIAFRNFYVALMQATPGPGRQPVCKSVCRAVSPCKHGLTDRGPVWRGDSWGPKEHCVRRESRFSFADSMRPSRIYFGNLFLSLSGYVHCGKYSNFELKPTFHWDQTNRIVNCASLTGNQCACVLHGSEFRCGSARRKEWSAHPLMRSAVGVIFGRRLAVKALQKLWRLRPKGTPRVVITCHFSLAFKQ